MGIINTGVLMSKQIVFYDGECGLCEHSVQWLLRRDKLRKLCFAPLGGSTAQEHLAALSFPPDLDSLIFWDEGQVCWYSDAPLRAVSYLPARWSWLRLGLVFPKSIRDWVYRLIARHRLRIFGAATNCRLPSPEESQQLLP